MKFRDQKLEDVQLDLTPLIDVVFLLLIFFMVSTTFSKESQLHIKLPEASTSSPEERKSDVLQIEISQQGSFAVRGPNDKTAKPLINTDPETLFRALAASIGANKDVVTIIRADKRTPHESVIHAMDASRRLGLLHVTFSTQQKNEETR